VEWNSLKKVGSLIGRREKELTVREKRRFPLLDTTESRGRGKTFYPVDPPFSLLLKGGTEIRRARSDQRDFWAGWKAVAGGSVQEKQRGGRGRRLLTSPCVGKGGGATRKEKRWQSSGVG